MRKCPIDDFTLAEFKYEGVVLDHCPHCQGVWLDAGELEAIQDIKINDYYDALKLPENLAEAAYEAAQAQEEKQLKCVTCKTEMTKKDYGFGSQVIIDKCPKGHGMWLDKGELEKLEMFYEREQNLADEWEEEHLKESTGVRGFFYGLVDSLRG